MSPNSTQIGNPVTMDVKEKCQRLRDISIFAGLDDKYLTQLCPFIQVIKIPADTQFIVQNDFSDCFYVILSGQTRVYWKDDEGLEFVLADFGQGECLGEMGYFSKGHRTASVTSLRPLELLKIYYTDLDRAFEVAPALAGNILRLVTGRLRQINFRFQENIQKTRVVEQSLESLQAFIDMSEILTLRIDIEGLIERVVYTASKMMQADRASLFLLDPLTGELWSKVAQGNKKREIRVPAGQGVIGWVLVNDEFVNITDPYNDSRFNPEVDRKTGYKTRSILCGPVKNLRGEIVGVIQVINKDKGLFDNQDETLFRAFAYQTTIALENFHIYQKMMAGHEKMVVMLDVATSVNQTLDLNNLIHGIIKKISMVLNSERSSLFMLDQEAQELWSKEAQGDDFTEIRLPLSEGLTGYVARTGELLNVHDAYKDPRFNPEIDKMTGYVTSSALCAPILNRQGEIIGVTQAINKMGGSFDNEDEGLIRAMASQIGVALENAQLHDNVEGAKNYLTSVQESISNSIITIDRECGIVTANRAAKDFFAINLNDGETRDLRQILGDANTTTVENIQAVLESRQPNVDYNVELQLSNGEVRTCNLNALPLFDHRQEFQGVILICEDITREKRFKSTLYRYMAKDIADKVLEEADSSSLGGTRTDATILFSDIRDFTSIAERLQAEETVEFLNDYFTRMVDVVFEHGGILDKYIGDSIMAVYGVPYSDPDGNDAKHAVASALAMKSVLAEINEMRLLKGESAIGFGIGINSGTVISGNIGSEKRMEFTVIGDSVNIASRLENLTKLYGNSILISEFTEKEVSKHFCTRLIDNVIVKGKNQPVKIFDVLGDSGYSPTAAESAFVDGFAAYSRRDFSRALTFFESGAPSDPPCRLFQARCRHFVSYPPPSDWNYVWKWTHK